ncbi:MAG TPA: DEAD/DEAH box helicase [Verrucomicrobiota bacterium]|nr:helicase [Verrucomicrobiales bacterium]HRI11898.1 DEAD/DEAH box helicase [Verrucomicrobiota bacterium]
MSSDRSPVSDWFARTFEEPTPAQAAAWPLIRAGHHALIVSPTGTGKTFAAFFEVLDQLAREHSEGKLTETLHAVYVSPLRALSYDLEKNLRGPLQAIYGSEAPIRVGLRSGDTDPTERQQQFARPPHLLLTTPESLALMLSQPKWSPHLRALRWVIVDEIHALADNKRGTQLALCLERLEALKQAGADSVAGPSLQRIGLSATVHPLTEIGQFLVGTDRDCRIVDVSAAKQIELALYSPLQKNPYPLAGFSGVRMIQDLGRLVKKHRTTLVFCNTRSGAESAAFGLKQAHPELADKIECHHGSLDRDVRLQVEDRLKRGELRCVVCSTSLELGLDIGSIDLVVMMSTPKGVSKALQRTGRAGHNLREVSRGLLMATNVNDLVECAATARLARRGHLDALRIPEAPLDVLAQQLMGMGCQGEMPMEAAYHLVRRAYPYRNLPRADFDAVLQFLAGGGASLRQQYAELFGKIVADEARGVFEARPGSVRRDFLQNVGTIPTDGVIRILLRQTQLGTVEESFLRRIKIGDVFSLGGRAVRLDRVGTMEAWVSRADGATPTIPRWGANKMPLSNRVGQEITSFRSELRSRIEAMPFRQTPSLIPWIAERLECSPGNATVIFRMHAAQCYVSEIPTAEFLLVEELRAAVDLKAERPDRVSARRQRSPLARSELLLEFAPTKGPTQARHYFFHCLIGRAANDALSRVVALRLSRLRGGNVVASPDDYGFVLTVAEHQRISEADLAGLFNPEGLAAELETSLARSDLLKYHFRNAAQTGLLVYRNYFGEHKSVRKLQWSSEVIFNVLSEHEPDHVLLREARRDAIHSFLDVAGALRFAAELQSLGAPVRLRSVEHVPPLSFGMYATQIREALLVEDPHETLERLYHHWWNQLGHSTAELLGTEASTAG